MAETPYPSTSSGTPATYFEYAWVCAPNAAVQSITSNIETVLTIDTEVSDSSNTGSISSNQVTIPSGTYYFKGKTNGAGASTDAVIFSLYNVTDSTYVTRQELGDGATAKRLFEIDGQFTISSSKSFSLKLIPNAAFTIGASTAFSNSTASASQRTTLKLWKLA